MSDQLCPDCESDCHPIITLAWIFDGRQTIWQCKACKTVFPVYYDGPQSAKLLPKANKDELKATPARHTKEKLIKDLELTPEQWDIIEKHFEEDK